MSSEELPPPTPERVDEENDDDMLKPFDVVPQDPQAQLPRYEDIEHYETFREILSALPVEHVKASEVDQPRELLARLIGTVHEEFIEGIGAVRAESYAVSDSTDWSEMMVLAAQVGSTTPQPFFNKLLSPDESAQAPRSRDFKSEMEFLLGADRKGIGRKWDVLGELLSLTGAYVHRVRAEWTAALVKLIHLCGALFKPAMRPAFGSKATMIKRAENACKTVSVYDESSEPIRDMTSGKFYDLDIFIYETLAHLALPELRLSGLLRMIDMTCLAEYHAVRCAIDASSSSVLYICLMSKEYLLGVWQDYMRMYFPRMFVVHEGAEPEALREYRESTTLPKWTHLEFYLPSPHQCASCDPEDFIPFLQSFFTNALTPEFRASFSSIATPGDYTILRVAPGEIFTVASEPKRRSKRIRGESTVLDMKRTRVN